MYSLASDQSDHGFTGLTGFAADVLYAVGDIGVGLLVLVEMIFPPIPSEVILPFAGYLTQTGSLTIVGLLLWSTLGALLGSLVYYGIGRAIGMKRAIAIMAWTRIISLDDLERGVAWFEKYGAWSVLAGRMIPGIRSVISLPAGAARMHLLVFSVFSFVGALGWNSLLIGMGAALGTQHELLEQYLAYLDYVVYSALALAVAVLVIRRLREAARTRRLARAELQD